MAVVQFNRDISPYMLGDVVRLEGDEKKRIDDLVKERGMKDAYSEVKAEKPAPTTSQAKKTSK